MSQITLQYRRDLGDIHRPATLRDFANWLNQALAPHNRRISHQSVKNWSDKRFVPDPSIMKTIAEEANHDLRGDFAREILKAIESAESPSSKKKVSSNHSSPPIFKTLK